MTPAMPSLFRLLLALAGLAVTARGAVPLTTPEGFAVPQPGHRFTFPRDHGSHPEFKIEWWYLTGHLFARPADAAAGDTSSRRFGFQATFFRQAGPRGAADQNPVFGTGHLFLAHMALAGYRFDKRDQWLRRRFRYLRPEPLARFSDNPKRTTSGMYIQTNVSLHRCLLPVSLAV